MIVRGTLCEVRKDAATIGFLMWIPRDGEDVERRLKPGDLMLFIGNRYFERWRGEAPFFLTPFGCGFIFASNIVFLNRLA